MLHILQNLIVVLIVILTKVQSQSSVKINDVQKYFQFGYDQQYEIVYDNSEKYGMIEFNLGINMDSYLEDFKNLSFALFATGTKLENDSFIQNAILRYSYQSVDPYSNDQIKIIQFDREGFGTAQKELKIRLDKNDILNYPKIYFYVYGPYKFGQKIPVQGNYQFKGSYSLTDKLDCFNDCSSNQNKGFCDKIYYQCSCNSNQIGRDCSKTSQEIQIDSKYVQSKQLKANQKDYLYFEMIPQIFELDKTINIQIALQQKTTLRVAYIVPDLENGIFLPDYTLWLNFYSSTDQVAIINDEGSIQIQTDQSFLNQRVILLFYPEDDTNVRIKVSYIHNQSLLISDMTVLYIIIGVVGCIILIWTCFYMNRKLRGLDIRDSFQNQYNQNNQTSPLELSCKKEKRIQLKINEIEQYMPSISYNQNLNGLNTQQECAICLDQFINKDSVRVTMCQHIFHNQCLDQWLQNQQNCPVCRNDLSLQNLQEYKKYPEKYFLIKGIKMMQIQIQNQNINDQDQSTNQSAHPTNIQIQGNNQQIQVNIEQIQVNNDQIVENEDQIKDNDEQMRENNDQQEIQKQQIN